MAVEKVTARIAESDAEIEFEYNFGNSLGELVENFTEEVCFAHTKRSLIVAAQGHARGLMRQAKSKDEILAAMAKWRPGLPRQSKSTTERLSELLAKMSPEERAQVVKDLKATSKAA